MNRRSGASEFGRLLRTWRTQRGRSQVELAAGAGTTPRHVSFLETGRSRPGTDLVLRLGAELELPARAKNALLIAAGLPAAFPDRGLDDVELVPFREAINALLDGHEPLPAAVIDRYGAVRGANTSFETLAPGVVGREPEELVQLFFGAGPWKDAIANWPDAAAAWLHRHRSELRRTEDPRLKALIESAERLIGASIVAERPGSSSMFCARIKHGDEELQLFAAVVRFDVADDVLLSELRVELLYPRDEATRRFFQARGATAADANGSRRGAARG